MFKNIARIAILAIVLFVIFEAILIFVFTQDVGEKTVLIERGMDVFGVANLLKREKVIENRLGFIIYVTLTGNISRLQAGEYTFRGEYALYQIADLVSYGLSLSSQKTVFIREGATIKQIDEELASAGVEPIGKLAELKIFDFKRDFAFFNGLPASIESLEGFLFPDTYHFEKRSPISAIARKMIQNFESKTSELYQEAVEARKDFYEIVILASILEKEVPADDMARAAGVLSKRISADIALQADATLVYGLGRPIRRGDINNFKSPYNSYLYRGLPPTPISNPSLAALRAALNPEKNNYWYYLSRRDNGETIFSRTLEEHNIARAKYLD